MAGTSTTGATDPMGTTFRNVEDIVVMKALLEFQRERVCCINTTSKISIFFNRKMWISAVILGLVVLLITVLVIIQYQPNTDMAVAVFKGDGGVVGETIFRDERGGCRIVATFTALPPGQHGFHIHVAGDLRGEGCKGACAHYHKGGAARHGGAPGSGGERHTGDLGNIRGPTFRRSYFLSGVRCADLWGRSLIVHADEDDLGLGGHEDSATTGNSGARIACSIIGRVAPCQAPKKTRKHK